MRENAIILLSGGIDSTTTLYIAKRKYNLIALIFDYGQRHKKEIDCAKKIASLNRIKFYIVKIDLNWANSSLVNKNIKIPLDRDLNINNIPNTYVPARNIIFLSYAFSLAESLSIKNIFIGAHSQDYSGYPDCRIEFLKKFNYAVNLGLKSNNIKIIAPIIDKNKKEIIKIGLKLNVPFKYTWSCYSGLKKPCLRCDSCRFRINAFESLGLKDPLLE